jgi:hypothetical protein
MTHPHLDKRFDSAKVAQLALKSEDGSYGDFDLTKTMRENLQAAITYFKNHLSQMDYAQFRQQTYPIGSGVTEAACKALV